MVRVIICEEVWWGKSNVSDGGVLELETLVSRNVYTVPPARTEIESADYT